MKRHGRIRRRLTGAYLGAILFFFVRVSSLSVHRHLRATTCCLSAAADGTDATRVDETCLYYSYSFQRHVVQRNDTVLASFEFLDDAQEAYPAAIMTPLQVFADIAGGGLEETIAYAMECDTIVKKSFVETLIQAMPLEKRVVEVVQKVIPQKRFSRFTPVRIRRNLEKFESLLERKFQLGSSTVAVVNNFPQVLLYDPRHVEERLDFLVAPLPPISNDCMDWPLLACQGYGAGWTIDQVRQALQAVPHVVLSMYLEDTFAMKPSLFYFLSALHVPFEDVEPVRMELDEWGDIYTFAFLRGGVNLEWHQLRMMLQAFPCLSVCATEPTWEMMGPDVRSVLKEDALHYIQRRLQVGPSAVEAMIKTHPQLSAYSVKGKIRPTIDALQCKLGFSSSELRNVILRMPSLIGMSIDESVDRGLMQRLKFFYEEVGMTQSEIRQAALKQPSLLQYSVENSLQSKLDFFIDEIYVPLSDMPHVITRCPSLMGLSLEHTLRPTTTVLKERCGLKPKELGDIISRAPNILVLSLKRNIEPKLDYLRDRLGLSKSELKQLICTTPRILLHSIKSSLEPKLQMIEAALGNERSAMRVVTQNPTLLVTSMAGLQQRLGSCLNDVSKNGSRTAVKKALQPRSKGVFQRKRPVLEIDPATEEVIREFPSASVAAKELGTGLPNMYNICQTGRLWKGKKLVYGTLPDEELRLATGTPMTTSSHVDELQNNVANKTPLVFKDLKSALSTLSDSPESLSSTNATLRIIVYVSGRVYPPDASTQVRGTRRAGGMALWFPQIDESCGLELAMRLRLAAKKSFGQIMPADDDNGGTCYSDGRILIGFPYLRPSRNRCELYACHEAIKVVAQLLKHEASVVSLQNETVQVDVYTDSDYAWKLLHNTTRLHHWGTITHEKEFSYDGPGPAWRANPDLLYPLCRTYFRLVEQLDSDETPLKLGESINVTFHHAASSMTSLHRYAKEAAKWMDHRAKTAIKR